MISLSTSAPPRHDRAILLCADANYHKFAVALIKQICDRLPKRDFDICLVSQELLPLPSSLVHLPVRMCQITVDKGETSFPERAHVNFSAYLRLFAVTALAESYGRILYLDSDIAFTGGDLSKLLDVPLVGGRVLGAVRDRMQQLDYREMPQDAKIIGAGHFPYFNSGVLLVDTDRWLEQGMIGRILETIRQHGHAFTYTDQSALNLTLRGDWAELSWKWNWIYQQNSDLQMRTTAPHLVHFAGPTKPWAPAGRPLPRKHVQWYRQFLATHYPDSCPDASGTATSHEKQSIGRTIRRNIKKVRALSGYKSRIPPRFESADPWLWV